MTQNSGGNRHTSSGRSCTPSSSSSNSRNRNRSVVIILKIVVVVLVVVLVTVKVVITRPPKVINDFERGVFKMLLRILLTAKGQEGSANIK